MPNQKGDRGWNSKKKTCYQMRSAGHLVSREQKSTAIEANLGRQYTAERSRVMCIVLRTLGRKISLSGPLHFYSTCALPLPFAENVNEVARTFIRYQREVKNLPQ